MADSCPCGSEKALKQCCLPVIEGAKKPATAEDLLRARYTAFTRGDIDYIVNTHHSKTQGEVNRQGIEEWSKQSEWLGLEILDKVGGSASDTSGTIDFHVKYRAGGKLQDHREHSVFEKENGDWRFLDAAALGGGTYRRAEPKIGRNDPCTCGSGKKFKKCCGSAEARA